jgi:hypothetical protein
MNSLYCQIGGEVDATTLRNGHHWLAGLTRSGRNGLSSEPDSKKSSGSHRSPAPRPPHGNHDTMRSNAQQAATRQSRNKLADKLLLTPYAGAGGAGIGFGSGGGVWREPTQVWSEAAIGCKVAGPRVWQSATSFAGVALEMVKKARLWGALIVIVWVGCRVLKLDGPNGFLY